MTTAKKLKAGNEIDSRCLKCKDITNHTIIAMAEEKVAKVQCNVCGGRHNYRPAKPEKTATKKKKATPRKSTAISKEAKAIAYFEKMIEGRDQAMALAYEMTGNFQEEDLLDHPVFGLGLVTRTIMPNKIEVLFKEGSKLLICELQQSKL